MIINAKNLQILKTNFSNGRKHDFRLFKESKPVFHPSTVTQSDTGYQGIQKIRKNSIIPYKKKRNVELTKAEKKFNHALSSKRIFVEHVIGRLKRFKIISERYRNRRKRFGLRFNLIAGVYNFEL